MRVKKRIIIAFLLVVLMIFTGCNNKSVDTNQPTDKPNVNVPSATMTPPQGFTVNKIDFQVVNFDDLASEKIEFINNLATLRGYYYWRDDNGKYTLFIGMGEKPTGGFSIKVISVEDNEGKTNILVEETIPKKDDIVSQALTYPYLVIEMKGITDQFNIANTSKEEYKALDIDELKVNTVEGIYQGQIDNNSIEVKIGETFMVFRNTEMTKLIAGYKKDDIVKITYSISESGQFNLVSIEPVK